MATLTYNPADPEAAEFTEEEQEALKVGESLEEQQNELLAGKFKDAEDLEKGYIELQKKLGDNKPEDVEEEVTEEDETDEPVDILDRLWHEAGSRNVSEETVKELFETDPRELAKSYLDYRNNNQNGGAAELSEDSIHSLQGSVGGEEAYNGMLEWAGQSLRQGEMDMFDAVMQRGDPLSCFFAIQALNYRYMDATGVEGEMLTGTAAPNKADAYRSQAEVVEAMQDPRYEKDPAYRQDVYDKLERSPNLQY
tara:strand:- start:1545 stop:2300 length:756 start_codon:yes stop_codon:yes gene_type:complete